MGEIVRKEVLDALDEAEARGEKAVRVIIGLRTPGAGPAVEDALRDLGIPEVVRRSDRFVVATLSRKEIERVSQLTEHVSRIWLDRPVFAADP